MTTIQVTAQQAELKVSFGRERIGALRRQLGLQESGKEGNVAFLDDPTVGAALPLIRAGVILRIRWKKSGEAKATVKLRPGRRTQLSERWIDLGGELKLEHDHGRQQAVLAVSLDGEVDAEILDGYRAGRVPGRQLFTPTQRAFLDDCADLRVNLDQLHLFGPITSERWEGVDLRHFGPGPVDVERWEAGGLELIEVSTKVKTLDTAGDAQQELIDALADLGLVPDLDGRTKTEQMLHHLAPR